MISTGPQSSWELVVGIEGSDSRGAIAVLQSVTEPGTYKSSAYRDLEEIGGASVSIGSLVKVIESKDGRSVTEVFNNIDDILGDE